MMAVPPFTGSSALRVGASDIEVPLADRLALPVAVVAPEGPDVGKDVCDRTSEVGV